MKIHITPERQAYFEARGKTILNACPGSGKTTCIVHKMHILKEECIRKYGRHAGIACLSFTNTAKQEIRNRYRDLHLQDLHYPHAVSTIDSFFNKHITLPFYNLIHPRFKRPKIVDDENVINNLFRSSYQDKTGALKEGYLSNIIRYKNKKGLSLCFTYSPSDIWISAEGSFSYKGNKPDSKYVEPAVFQSYGKSIFNYKIQKGILTSQDSAYIALYILNKYKSIGEWLLNRFPYFLIDEAQDNSEIQHQIFDKLVDLGLENIELIGDPYQSLYEWRDAKPDLFLEKFESEDWNGLTLSHNRRSVQRIIDCFSLIRQPRSELIISECDRDLGLPITIYLYSEQNYSSIIKDFEYKCEENQLRNNQIVVRGKSMLNQLSGISSGINPWKEEYPTRLLNIIRDFDDKKIKDAINKLRLFILELSSPNEEYGTIKENQLDKEKDYYFNAKLYEFLSNISNTSYSFEDWTSNVLSKINEIFEVDASDAFIFKQKMRGFKMSELKRQNVNSYFNKDSTIYNTSISTIHQVKGVTLDGILYFFDHQSKGQSVSFNDFKRTTAFPAEKQRIIYVACSRPQQLLAMAFHNSITEENLRDKFGNEIEIVTLSE